MKKKIKMAIKMKSKKADSKLLSIWWFAVLVVILAGILIGTSVFFSDKVDVRYYEANALGNRIADCIVYKGVLNEEYIADKSKILADCFISDNVSKDGNYYINITIDYGKANIKELIFGNAAFEKDCPIGNAMKSARNYPKCLTKEFEVYDAFGNKVKIEIKTGSNKEYRVESK